MCTCDLTENIFLWYFIFLFSMKIDFSFTPLTLPVITIYDLGNTNFTNNILKNHFRISLYLLAPFFPLASSSPYTFSEERKDPCAIIASLSLSLCIYTYIYIIYYINFKNSSLLGDPLSRK